MPTAKSRTGTTVTETRTYRGPGEAGPPRLAGLAGVHQDPAVPVEVIEIERHDTDDHRLAAAGITLAVHRGGEEAAHWRLDLPDGDTAERLRVPLPTDPDVAPSIPDEVAELVRGAARERAVRPVGRVRTVRTSTRLRTANDRVIATVVHGEITVASLGASTEVQGWTEVELRLTGANAAQVTGIEARITESGVRPGSPAGEAELDRLLRPTPTRRRTAGRHGSAGAVVVGYLAAQVDRLAAEDLRVRRGETDSVHRLRVAARRLRGALQSYRPLLERDRTDPLVDALRELGRALAPARDVEVLRDRISAGLSGLEPTLLLGPVQAQVTRHFARAESEAHAAVLTALDGPAYATLRRGLDELVEHPPLTKAAARPAAKVLPSLVTAPARRLDRAVAVALDAEQERDVAVHTARKAAKRLRYATEVVPGKSAGRFAAGLKQVQLALGEHQDTVVAREALRELGAQAHAAGENGFAFGVLYGRDAARATRIERDLPALWAEAWKPKRRRWIS